MYDEKLIKVFRDLIRKEMTSIKTCFPCEVISVDGSRVGVKIDAQFTKSLEYPEINDVPIMMIKGGDALISLPTVVGDKGILFVSTKSILQFKDGTPSFITDFDLDNSFYFGGVFQDKSEGTNNNVLKITKGSSIIELDGSIVKLGSGGASIARVGDEIDISGLLDSQGGALSGTATIKTGGENTST